VPDVDQVPLEVDVLVTEPAQLATAQPGVERARPQRDVVLGERGEQPCRLGR
jgi:hypothetical protein